MACKNSPIGKMRQKIAVQAVTQTPDSQGGFTESWATSATVWASIEPASAFEKFQSGQTDTPITHKIMMRYLSGVTTKKRLLYGSRVFDIKEVINIGEANTFLKITAIEN